MTPSLDNLSPCPFCKGEKLALSQDAVDRMIGNTRVFCKTCAASASYRWWALLDSNGASSGCDEIDNGENQNKDTLIKMGDLNPKLEISNNSAITMGVSSFIIGGSLVLINIMSGPIDSFNLPIPMVIAMFLMFFILLSICLSNDRESTQKRNYDRALSTLNKDLLLKHVKSLELSSSERAIATSVAKRNFPNWSLE